MALAGGGSISSVPERDNGLLILKYSAIYGIAAVGAAIVIISGGIDLAPGAVMALAGVVGAHLFVVAGLVARTGDDARASWSGSARAC